MPMTCTGRPSADASSRLSPVISAQEKSRAMFRTAERPVRSSVFSISRTIESSRFAITASVTGSKELIARAPLRRLATALGPLRRELEQVVPELRDERRSSPGRRRPSSSARAIIAGPRSAFRQGETHRRSVGRLASPVSLKYASTLGLGAGRRRLSRPQLRLVEHGRRTHLPEQALQVLARLAHGEDALVRARGTPPRPHATSSSDSSRRGTGTSSSHTWAR